jgi:hypothetical protein
MIRAPSPGGSGRTAGLAEIRGRPEGRLAIRAMFVYFQASSSRLKPEGEKARERLPPNARQPGRVRREPLPSKLARLAL